MVHSVLWWSIKIRRTANLEIQRTTEKSRKVFVSLPSSAPIRKCYCNFARVSCSALLCLARLLRSLAALIGQFLHCVHFWLPLSRRRCVVVCDLPNYVPIRKHSSETLLGRLSPLADGLSAGLFCGLFGMLFGGRFDHEGLRQTEGVTAVLIAKQAIMPICWFVC